MKNLALYPVIIFFLVMGIVSLYDPATPPALFGITQTTADFRNEVRAIYGGYGLFVGFMLIASFYSHRLRPGIRVAVALSVCGMAFGRIVSVIIEPTDSTMPITFIFVELAMAALVASTTIKQHPSRWK